jgi:hypothetical protein
MLRWAFRFFLLRVLPGRLLWFMTLADIFFLLRSIRRWRLGEGPRPGPSWAARPAPRQVNRR